LSASVFHAPPLDDARHFEHAPAAIADRDVSTAAERLLRLAWAA
jgi:hypothetical protein